VDGSENLVVGNGCSLSIVEERVGDNIGERMVVEWCNLGGMGCWKGKVGIGMRVAGIGVGWMPGWCIEKFVQIGKSLVAGLLSRKNQHRWVVKI
jgi:hypothetical protein